MLNIHQVGVSFSGTHLFSNITFRVNPGDKVGLIGKNGAGKSTLLKIMAGVEELDDGTIAVDKGVRVGYLPQDLDFEEGRTVLEEAYMAFKELKELEYQLEGINQQLAEQTDYEKSKAYEELLVNLSEVTALYENLGGYSTEEKLNGC